MTATPCDIETGSEAIAASLGLVFAELLGTAVPLGSGEGDEATELAAAVLSSLAAGDDSPSVGGAPAPLHALVGRLSGAGIADDDVQWILDQVKALQRNLS